MTTLNISIPDALREFIDARVQTGEYASASEFVRELVRREKQALDQLLGQGLDSGDAAPLDFARVRAKAKAKLKKESRAG